MQAAVVSPATRQACHYDETYTWVWLFATIDRARPTIYLDEWSIDGDQHLDGGSDHRVWRIFWWGSNVPQMRNVLAEKKRHVRS